MLLQHTTAALTRLVKKCRRALRGMTKTREQLLEEDVRDDLADQAELCFLCGDPTTEWCILSEDAKLDKEDSNLDFERDVWYVLRMCPHCAGKPYLFDLVDEALEELAQEWGDD
jgi:hypothetical protein